MTLFINACVRKESRTRRLAGCLLARLDRPITELRLEEVSFPVTDEAFLLRRDQLLNGKEYQHPMFQLARQFAAADQIVIAAPYWDLSFPASLKQYLEQINAVGITFRYTPEGIPEGLCRAERLFYVTTAGGTFVPHEYGFSYVKALAENYYGIPDVRLIQAVGLDLDGADPEQILREAADRVRASSPSRDGDTV